jgi:HSP20 family protein
MPVTARWSPQQNLDSIHSQLSRFLEPFTRMADEDLVSGAWVPPVDVAETQEKIIVRAEVPGMKQEEIQIEFENGLLSIRGERKLIKEEGVTFHRVERTFGNFSRSFTLPRTIDPEKISASYRDGVLQIEVPKKEEAKPKQIRIAVNS